MQTTIHIAKSPVRVRISKAVTTVQLVIVIAIVIVVIGGVFLFNPSRDSTPPVVVLKAISTKVEEDNPIQFSAVIPLTT
jgi:multidrug efflux pump subunit AcrA (membrane-fusion protein)